MLVRDLFISHMKNVELQETLASETLAPEKVVKRAQRIEYCNQIFVEFVIDFLSFLKSLKTSF